MTEEQVVDADLDDIELATDSDDDDERGSATATEAAPQCAGCHRRGIGLTLLENGKRYCERCAQEVERLMGIGPLFPSAAELADDPEHDHDHDDASEILEPEPAVAEQPEAAEDLSAEESDEGDDSAAALAAEPVAAVEPAVDDERDEVLDDDDVTSETAEPEPVVVEQPEGAAPAIPTDADAAGPDEETLVSEVSGDDDNAASDAEPIASEVTAELQAEPIPEQRSDADLKQLIADTNHEAANSTSSLIPRPTTRMNADEAEETEPMERVESQVRPVPLNDASPTSGPPPTDLQGVLGAERSRLLDQRAAIEARFRADVEAIDDRLVHVESLLGDGRQALAS